jgi:hypothetical protein
VYFAGNDMIKGVSTVGWPWSGTMIIQNSISYNSNTPPEINRLFLHIWQWEMTKNEIRIWK